MAQLKFTQFEFEDIVKTVKVAIEESDFKSRKLANVFAKQAASLLG